MMESMSVRPEQVTGLSEQIRGGATSIRNELNELESKVSTLRGQWGGEAQLSYDEAQRKWTKSLAEMQQLLEQIATKTDEMGTQYTQKDKSAAGRFAL